MRRIPKDEAIEKIKNKSKRNAGSGTIIKERIPITPKATRKSELFINENFID